MNNIVLDSQEKEMATHLWVLPETWWTADAWWAAGLWGRDRVRRTGADQQQQQYFNLS